jgi:hypothetical protein
MSSSAKLTADWTTAASAACDTASRGHVVNERWQSPLQFTSSFDQFKFVVHSKAPTEINDKFELQKSVNQPSEYSHCKQTADLLSRADETISHAL